MTMPETKQQDLVRKATAAPRGVGFDLRSERAAMAGILFNAAVEPRARALAECADEGAVRDALRFASRDRLPVAVVNGGHDPWARGFAEGTLVLDVRRLKRIRVNAEAGEVTLGGGVLASELLAAIPVDSAVTIGICLSVGVVGLTLGGGYGNLANRFGLAADSLKRARVVLADGSVAIASERDDADLLWALRGGGAGFGVVTEMTVALHHLHQVLCATVLVPLDDAAKAMRAVQGTLDAEPEALSVTPALSTGPDGQRALMLLVLWSGGETRGASVVDALAAECGGNVRARRWSTYQDSFDPAAEAAWPKQSNYCIRTRNLRRLDDDTIEVLVDGARRMPGPMDALFLHDFHGAAARVPVGATAFSARRDHYAVEVVGHWERDEPSGDHIAWVEELTERLSTIALPGGYPNLLGPDETERVRDYYGAAAERLLATKRRVDPQNLLRSAIGRLT